MTTCLVRISTRKADSRCSSIHTTNLHKNQVLPLCSLQTPPICSKQCKPGLPHSYFSFSRGNLIIDHRMESCLVTDLLIGSKCLQTKKMPIALALMENSFVAPVNKCCVLQLNSTLMCCSAIAAVPFEETTAASKQKYDKWQQKDSRLLWQC